jgi:hypothetical protein
MTRGAALGAVAILVPVLCTVGALAQPAGDRFTATASVKQGDVSAAAKVAVTVQRYASEAERDTVVKTVREKGTAGAQKLLVGLDDVGSIQVGGQRTAVKFALRRPTPSGELVMVLTAAPLLFLGGGLPAAKPNAGFDIAVAILDIQSGGNGVGELAPAAKIGIDEAGALQIQDYGATVVWLNSIARAK